MLHQQTRLEFSVGPRVRNFLKKVISFLKTPFETNLTIESPIQLRLLNTQNLSPLNYQKVLYSSKSVREKNVFKTKNDWRKQFYFDSIAKSMDRTVFRNLKQKIRKQNRKEFQKFKPKKVD